MAASNAKRLLIWDGIYGTVGIENLPRRATMESDALVIGLIVGLAAICVTLILGLFAISWQIRNRDDAHRAENRRRDADHREEVRQRDEIYREEVRRMDEARREEVRQRDEVLREEVRQRDEQHLQREEAISALMESIRTRVSDTELEQARLEGVNSVLRQHLHTHEVADD